MKKLKQLCLFLLIVSDHLISTKSYDFDNVEPEYQRSRFKSLKCISQNQSIVTFKYCRIKVTRTSSMVAVNFTFYPKVDKPLYTRVTMSYKYGLIYREVVKVPQFEMCGILKNLNQMPPFVKGIFDVFGESFAPILKGCPFVDKLNLFLIADFSKFPSILPTGMYRVNTYFETTKTKLGYFSCESELVSNIKTSF